MFINAAPIFSILDMYRLIWISGRVGGHKTALAYRIAQDYLEKGYRLISNNKSVWADDPEKIELIDGHLKAVILMDEGGLYFKSGRQVEQIASYLAKMDMMIIFPSFWPPARVAQIVNIQPVISLKPSGLPVIIYKWSVQIGSFRDKGWFAWINPQEIYGIYSRQDPGADADQIIDYLIRRTNEFRQYYGHANKISMLEEVTEADQFSEAAQVIEDSASELATVFTRINKRRR